MLLSLLCVIESSRTVKTGRQRWSRGLKDDDDMLQWLDRSTDTRNHDNAMRRPFSLLSASAYVITRIQLHAAFTIFFQADITRLTSPHYYQSPVSCKCVFVGWCKTSWSNIIIIKHFEAVGPRPVIGTNINRLDSMSSTVHVHTKYFSFTSLLTSFDDIVLSSFVRTRTARRMKQPET